MNKLLAISLIAVLAISSISSISAASVTMDPDWRRVIDLHVDALDGSYHSEKETFAGHEISLHIPDELKFKTVHIWHHWVAWDVKRNDYGITIPGWNGGDVTYNPWLETDVWHKYDHGVNIIYDSHKFQIRDNYMYDPNNYRTVFKGLACYDEFNGDDHYINIKGSLCSYYDPKDGGSVISNSNVVADIQAADKNASINNGHVQTKTDDKGKFSIHYKFPSKEFNGGEYKISLTYSGNNEHDPCDSIKTVNCRNLSVIVCNVVNVDKNIISDGADLVAYLSDYSDRDINMADLSYSGIYKKKDKVVTHSPISNQYVWIYFDNSLPLRVKTDENGTIDLSTYFNYFSHTHEHPYGWHRMHLLYNGDDNHGPCMLTKNIKLS